MGIFDVIQNIIGNVSDAAQGAVSDAVGGVADNQIVQDVQEQATAATESVTDTAATVQEEGQTVIDDLTQNLGL